MKIVTDSDVDMRTAALMLAIQRVARATTARRAIRQYLPSSLLSRQLILNNELPAPE